MRNMDLMLLVWLQSRSLATDLARIFWKFHKHDAILRSLVQLPRQSPVLNFQIFVAVSALFYTTGGVSCIFTSAFATVNLEC
jgi:hypothetical protein